MAFMTTDLTTLAGLTKYEAEINNFAKPYTRKALSVAAITQLTANPDTITAITAHKSNGTSVSLVKSTTWALPIGEYVRFVTDTTANDYFSLLEGSGSFLTSAGGGFTLTLGTAPTWSTVTMTSDWQPKIDLARQMIYDMLYTTLAGKIDVYYIADVIDAITNTEALSIAAEYKSLELIYMDLYGKIGTQEIVEAKIEFYRQGFKDAFDRAFPALDFGDYGYLMSNESGRISR